MIRTRTTLSLILLGACVVPAMTGCKSWAESSYTADITTPATVHRGEKLVFSVFLKDASGAVVHGGNYQWKVSWDGVEGINHKGKVGVEEKINVKGAPGTASLHVYGYDSAGTLQEIGKREFKVE
jgi:hypothetical protein